MADDSPHAERQTDGEIIPFPGETVAGDLEVADGPPLPVEAHITHSRPVIARRSRVQRAAVRARVHTAHHTRHLHRYTWNVLVNLRVGLWAAWCAWYDWVRYRDADDAKDKTCLDERARRRNASGVCALLLLLAGIVTWVLWRPYLYVGGACLAVVFAAVGRRLSDRPIFDDDRAPLALNGDALAQAFRDAKIVTRKDADAQVRRPGITRDPDNPDAWQAVVDLPRGDRASRAAEQTEALASALEVETCQLVLEQHGHAGRVRVWCSETDPFEHVFPWPLLHAERTSIWHGEKPAMIPWGVDQRHRQVGNPILWVSQLIGSIPRQGKTFAGWQTLAYCALDPYVDIYLGDPKKVETSSAMGQVARRHIAGLGDDAAVAFLAMCQELVREMEARFRRLAMLHDKYPRLCPDGKLNAQIYARPELGLPFQLLWVDEIQEWISCQVPQPHPYDPRKTVTTGALIVQCLEKLAQVGPQSGISVCAMTQRPDGGTIPTHLRSAFGVCFALKVRDWQSSDVILGGKRAAGMDASKISSRKGVGILVAGNAETDVADMPPTVIRTHLIRPQELAEIGRRGRALREAAGTLAGDALPTVDGYVVADSPELTAGLSPDRAAILQHVPEAPGWIGPGEVSRLVGRNVERTMQRMVRDGQLRSVGKGRYSRP